MPDVRSSDFLFTWKPDKWPYENLRTLIGDFEAGRVVQESWRCQAHRMVRPGDRAYLFKQGAPPRGIFAIAEVAGPAEPKRDARPGEGRHVVPLRFKAMVDPTQRFLVSEAQLTGLAPAHRWNSQASGIVLESEAARAIDSVAAKIQPNEAVSPQILNGYLSSSPSKLERLVEVYERDQRLVDELKRLYKSQCQICGSVPFNGNFGSIAEGHHIEWLCRGGSDSLDNLVLLCPNHHAAIHAFAPSFDWAKLEFRFGPKPVPIRVNSHLKSVGPPTTPAMG